MGNQQQGPSKDEIKQLTAKTSFKTNELTSLYADFKKIDKDKSGELDEAEFKNLLKTNILKGCDDATFKSMFKVFDADGSGTVSFKELATAMSLLGKGTAETKLGFLFDMYDGDKSGHLEKKEMEAIVAQMIVVAKALNRDQASANEFVKGLLAKIDKDGSGTISKEEWVQGGLRTPSLLVLLGASDY